MPANVDEMFSVRQVPWHREGHVLADYPQSWDEARVLAGLAWEPVGDQLYSVDGMNPDGTPHYAPVPGYKRIYRDDTGATLGIGSETYAIINHAEFGEIMSGILQAEPGSLKIETGGCLEGGKKVWMLVRLDEPLKIGRDKSVTMPYVALTSRHDTWGGCTARATAVRIVCANTFAMSELEGGKHHATYTFRHTKNWRDKIEDARRAVTAARTEWRAYADLAEGLLGVKITGQMEEQFVIEFIPAPPAGVASDRVLGHVEEARSRLRAILASPTVDGAGVRGTAYGLMQAGGEYLDHIRTARTWETRLGRTILSDEKGKARARKLALAVAKG